MKSEGTDLTTLIQQWQAGNRQAADQLIERVYPELKKIAGAYLQRERIGHTLAPTALVHELYLKLSVSGPLAVQNRTHFFALAAQSLRHLLVDYARRYRAQKRGGPEGRIAFGAAEWGFETNPEELLSVHEALTELAQLEARLAQVVELRYFGGLQEEEVAQVLGLSKITVQRDWRAARAWLRSRLKTARTPG
jgi:RNA polymerase sigma-70 factor, ECF subfamily